MLMQKIMETFGLNALCNQHIDFVESVLNRVKSYNNLSVLQSLVDSFQGVDNNPQDVSDFILETISRSRSKQLAFGKNDRSHSSSVWYHQEIIKNAAVK